MSDRILVVDDEKEIADLIEVYLRNENYEVYKFYAGREALACTEKEEMDLALRYHAAGYKRVYGLSEDSGEIHLSDHHADGEG